jgi:hypothetical protein
METQKIKPMNNIIETRKKVYQNFPKENLDANLADMVLFYNINENDYNELIEVTKNFLLKTMSLVYNKEFVWTDTFLEDYDDLITNLPNKTPNGIINPKKETTNEFEKIQIVTNNILNNLGVYKNIKKLAIPNLRYKSASEPETAKSRPYYTSKHHSDAWPGHVGDSVFLIGVLGDIDNNTVEFNEPINVHDNYLDKADSFDEGNTRYERFEYLGTLSKGKLGVMDHACLHRTLVKKDSKPRLSMDIAVMIDSEYSHANGEGFDPNAYNYYEPTIIQLIGKDHTYKVKESINDSIYTTTLSIENNIC